MFGGDAAFDPRTLAYDRAVAGASAADVPVPVNGTDPHIIRFSSGTTGKPKGIYHSVDRWTQFNNEWRWVTPMLSEQTRYLVPAALAHFGVSLLWGVLTVGGRIVPMPIFGAARALELMETQRITHAAVAPVMIREMVAEPTCSTRDLSALTAIDFADSLPRTTNGKIQRSALKDPYWANRSSKISGS